MLRPGATTAVAIVFVMSLLTAGGCDKTPIATNATQGDAALTFPVEGEVDLCSAKCCPATLFAVAAMLGLDPSSLAKGNGCEIQTFIRSRNSELGSEYQLHEISIVDLLDGRISEPTFPIVLMTNNGHYVLLHGVIKTDGGDLFQLSHGEGKVSLVARSDIRESQIVNAWMQERNHKIPIRVGRGTLFLDKLQQNIGEIMPNAESTCTFSLTNGDTPIVLEKIATTCTCIAANAVAPRTLGSGEVTALEFRLRSQNAPALNTAVVLELRDPLSGDSRNVLLSVIGNQRVFKHISPASIEFGNIWPERTYSRSLYITETPADKFVVSDVDTSELPIQCSIVHGIDKQGLRSYQIDCSLRVDESVVGQHSGNLRIITDSQYSPQSLVPVKFAVIPEISITPSSIAMGEVAVGEKSRHKVQAVSRSGRALPIVVDSLPPEVNQALSDRSEQPSLDIEVKLTRAGIWKGVIKGHVVTENREIPIEVLCIGIGTSPSSEE